MTNQENQIINFYREITNTFKEIPNSFIEFALAEKGCSSFNKALYLASVDEKKLKSIADMQFNIAFLHGCDKSYLPIPNTKGITKRFATNQCIKQKNLLVFDIDLKDNIEDYTRSDRNGKQLRCDTFKVDLIKKLSRNLIPYWAVVFSGNGFHIYLKCDPISIENPNEYKKIYLNILNKLEFILSVKFDSACSNPARIFRLPGSINWKERELPIKTSLVSFKPENNSNEFLFPYLTANSTRIKNFRGKSEIKEKLDFKKILTFFDYGKFNSILKSEEKIICSSPFHEDSTPSFHFDQKKKLFMDFSSGKSGDLFNLIAELGNLDIKKDFSAVLQYAKKIVGDIHEDTTCSTDRYTFNKKGVFYCQSDDNSKDNLWICSQIEVLAFSRCFSNNNWGKVIKITDSEGIEKTWTMPMEMLAGDGLELRRNLLKLGAKLNLSQNGKLHLMQFLSSSAPTSYCRLIHQLGWHEDAFILPDATYPSNSRSISETLLTNNSRSAIFHSKGSKEQWSSQIGKYLVGNSRLTLAVAAALTPPLLKLVGMENFGIHLTGMSSIGKTICLDVAGSIWGGGGISGYKNRWRSTVNGLESLAQSHNDTLLTLDELGEVSPKNASAASYMLANGCGKARSSISGDLQEVPQWRLVFLSSGEVDLNTHLHSEGIISRAGQEIRMINVPADAGKQFGILDCIHDFSTSADLIDHLKLQTMQCYGSPIRQYLEFICTTNLIDKISTHRQDFRNACQKLPCHGQVIRVRDKFSLLYAAACLGAESSIIQSMPNNLLDEIIRVFKNWLEINDCQNLENHKILKQIRQYLQKFSLNKFPFIEELRNNRVTNSIAGFRKKESNGQISWIILSEVFKNEICKGYNPKDVVKTLKEGGFLIENKNSKASTQLRIPHLGKVQVYQLNHEILCHQQHAMSTLSDLPALYESPSQTVKPLSTNASALPALSYQERGEQ